MEITNVRNHRIRWSDLLRRGAIVGLISAAVMLVVAAVSYPLVQQDADAWSFLRVIADAVTGRDTGVTPTGFDAGGVLLGLVVHLAIGTVFGSAFALLVGLFDLEGWTQVSVIGLIFGAYLFVWSTVVVQVIVGPRTATDLPLVVVFLGDIVFGITAGIMLATWARRDDLDFDEGDLSAAFEGDWEDPPVITPR